MVLWKKDFSFEVENFTDDYAQHLTRIDGADFDHFRVSVYIDTQVSENNICEFRIKSLNQRLDGWLFGTLEQNGEQVIVSGVAGIDPSIILFIFIALLAIPIVLFTLSNPSFKAFLFLSTIKGLFIGAMIYGGIHIRNNLITDLRRRF